MADKIIVCNAEEAERKVNPELSKGWLVKSVTAEVISVSISTGREYTVDRERAGKMVFVLEQVIHSVAV